ncbi:MAG TPA: hypothetical protein VM187_04880 [Niastella sp.]|nr:hypothetical protein [Niastella sp.]
MRTFLRHLYHSVKNKAILYVLLPLLLGGCIEHRYYVSPYNGNHSTYHPIPLKTDSVRSGYYVAGTVAIGGANDQGVDDVFAFHGNVSGGHNLGLFQAFYGLSLSAGNYKVDTATGVYRPGNKSFGGTGFEGGINVVMPFEGGEWRLIGVETSLYNEFGKYLQFRKTLPDPDSYDNVIDLVVRNKFYGTFGGYTEVITQGEATAWGFRIGGGWPLGTHYRNKTIYDPYEDIHLQYQYLYFTTHLTKNRSTGFMRLNAATKATNIMFGLNYRLGKRPGLK